MHATLLAGGAFAAPHETDVRGDGSVPNPRPAGPAHNHRSPVPGPAPTASMGRLPGPARHGRRIERIIDVPIWQAIVLGLVQGATEYAPVSSSGHLILVPWLFGWDQLGGNANFAKSFDVALHMGTLLGAVDLLPQRPVAIPRGVVRNDPIPAHRDDRRATRLGPGRRHDPGGDRGFRVGGRDPGHPRRPVADLGDARRLRRGALRGGPASAQRPRARFDRRAHGTVPGRRAGDGVAAGGLAVGGDDDRRPSDRDRPRDRRQVLVPALASDHRGRGLVQGRRARADRVPGPRCGVLLGVRLLGT